MMSASSKAQSSVIPPVLLCRLCHCEFTNFKEHVKSLVHLDARETKTTLQPATKNKISFDEKVVIAKKVKTENFSEQSSPNEDNEGDDMASEDKESISSENKLEHSTDNQLQDCMLSDEDKADADLNGIADLNEDNEIQDNKHKAVASNKIESKRDDEFLTNSVFLLRHWHCKLCDLVQCAEDGSFDKHVEEKTHQEALTHELSPAKVTVTEGDQNQWLISCSACAFETNDKAQFVSHLQTELHDNRVKNIIQDANTIVSDDTLKNHCRKNASEVLKTSTKSLANVTSPGNQKNTNSKSITHQAGASKSTSKSSYQRKTHGASGTKFNSSTKSLKPLMSVSLPENWSKNKPGWNSASASLRSHSPSSKPGILGEYRPDLPLSKAGIDRYGRGDWFSRPTDLRHSNHHDALPKSRIGSAQERAGRLSYSEVSRHALPATLSRRFVLDSPSSLPASDRYNAMCSKRTFLRSSTAKLNSWAFGQVEQEPPSRLDILANLLSSQRTLPSTVSLDLASNSSFNLKQGSERDSLFDNYSSSMSDASRAEGSRNNLSRMKLSSSDHYSRSMYSRR